MSFFRFNNPVQIFPDNNGLGLKTASFSQCRVFTVISRREAIPVTYWRWDIDYVTDPSTNGWKIVQTADKDDIRLIEEMGAGTIVIWENLDRIIEPKKRHKNGEDDFYCSYIKSKKTPGNGFPQISGNRKT